MRGLFNPDLLDDILTKLVAPAHAPMSSDKSGLTKSMHPL